MEPDPTPGAELVELSQRAEQLKHYGVPILLIFISLAAVAVWYRFLARKRLIQDLPTSKVQGVSLGLNELAGRAVSERPEISPQGVVECVWWKNTFYIEERNDGNQTWKKTGERVGGPIFFELEDETGRIPVWPRKADVRGEERYDGDHREPVLTSSSSPSRYDSLLTRFVSSRDTRRRRVVEQVIPLGGEVYVLGTARLPEERPQAEIGADPSGEDPYLIQLGSESDALYRERFGVVAAFVVALVPAAVVSPYALAAVAALMFALSLVFIYNGLIRLRQRAQQAWSLIDVQLRRRHDLIPNLAQVVTAHRDHERQVHEAVAQLRSRIADDLPARPSDEAVRAADTALAAETTAVRRLLALAEAYPELGAHESFVRLQAELTDTEDRIALAREFYNHSVEALRDRAHTFPGNVFAWVFEMDLEAEFTGGESRGRPATPEVRTKSPAELMAALRAASRGAEQRA